MVDVLSFVLRAQFIVSGRDPACHFCVMTHGCATAPDFHGNSPVVPDNNFTDTDHSIKSSDLPMPPPATALI